MGKKERSSLTYVVISIHYLSIYLISVCQVPNLQKETHMGKEVRKNYSMRVSMGKYKRFS